jgi:ribose transport system substrate-binding protein
MAPTATMAATNPSAVGTGPADPIPPSPKTHGPNGEAAASTKDLQLTDADIQQLKGKAVTAAILWPASFQFYKVASAGIKSELDKVGGKVLAETDSGYDPAKQANDVETVLARQPSLIFTWLVDPVQETDAFRRALAQGTKVSFMSNLPTGFQHPKDYVGVVTDDLYGMGQAAAELLADKMNKKGKIGWIFHDANSYVTNQRDRAFKEVLTANYPDMPIVAEGGFADPKQAGDVANAMILNHPEIDGIYVPWSVPAAGVVEALRANGKSNVKVITLDLDPTIAISLAKGENVVGIIADVPYEIGRGMAVEALWGLLGKTSPPFATVPTLKITKDNLITGWQASLKESPPPEVLNALK